VNILLTHQAFRLASMTLRLHSFVSGGNK